MKRLVGLLFTLCLLLPAFGGEATQTDWSGGDGVPGPVTDWGDQLDTSTDINWSGVPGEIGLSRAVLDPTIEHSVDGDFNCARSVYAADVDGDDDLYVLGAAAHADDITWWEVTGFTDNGVLTSSIRDTETDDLEWGAIDADADVPDDCDLTVEVRGSADDGNMGDWYTVDSGGDDLSNYLDQDDRYFQYRLTLEASSDNTQSPKFEYISVE